MSSKGQINQREPARQQQIPQIPTLQLPTPQPLPSQQPIPSPTTPDIIEVGFTPGPREQTTPDIIEVGFTPGNREQDNEVIEIRDYTDKEKKALLMLADRLAERKKDRNKNTICGSGEDIPIYFDPEAAAPDIPLNKYKCRLLKKFYAAEKRWVCSFPTCRKEVVGFGAIIDHLRRFHANRQYKYFCVRKTCMTPFNKLGNANRHFRNVHLNEYLQDESDDESIEEEYPTCEGHKTPGHVPWARPAKYFDAKFGRKCADALAFKNATHPSAKKVDTMEAFSVACTLQSLMYYSDRRVKNKVVREIVEDQGFEYIENPNVTQEIKECKEHQTCNCTCYYSKKH